MSSIVEHPNSALRREIETLKIRVKLLEQNQEQTHKAILVMADQNKSTADLLARSLVLISQMQPKAAPSE
jgi:hypothetical protein